jgi:hypothetical protein
VLLLRSLGELSSSITTTVGRRMVSIALGVAAAGGGVADACEAADGAIWGGVIGDR